MRRRTSEEEETRKLTVIVGFSIYTLMRRRIETSGYRSITDYVAELIRRDVTAKKIHVESKPQSIDDQIEQLTEDIGRVRALLDKRFLLLQWLRRKQLGFANGLKLGQIAVVEKRMWEYIVESNGGITDKEESRFYAIKRDDVRLYCKLLRNVLQKDALVAQRKGGAKTSGPEAEDEVPTTQERNAQLEPSAVERASELTGEILAAAQKVASGEEEAQDGVPGMLDKTEELGELMQRTEGTPAGEEIKGLVKKMRETEILVAGPAPAAESGRGAVE